MLQLIFGTTPNNTNTKTNPKPNVTDTVNKAHWNTWHATHKWTAIVMSSLGVMHTTFGIIPLKGTEYLSVTLTELLNEIANLVLEIILNFSWLDWEHVFWTTERVITCKCESFLSNVNQQSWADHCADWHDAVKRLIWLGWSSDKTVVTNYVYSWSDLL